MCINKSIHILLPAKINMTHMQLRDLLLLIKPFQNKNI